MNRLVFFTESFPYGIQELWKLRELECLTEQFEEIVVAPLQYAGNHVALALPPRVRVLPPLFETASRQFRSRAALRLLNRRVTGHLRALVSGLRQGATGPWTRRWAVDGLKAEEILRSAAFRQSVLPEMRGSRLYFFWGKGYADILPFLPRGMQRRAIVRMHGFDLYAEVNNGFIPYQSEIIASARKVLTVSRDGLDYLAGKYPRQKQKFHLARLGVVGRGRSPQSADGKFRLVSCAMVRPVKRIELIAHAMTMLPRSVEWTHVGEGQDFDALVELTRKLKLQDRVRFTGQLSSESVAGFYASQPFDLFLNVSASEGVPVSIMEALAAGIPVLATSVGGNPEIVDDAVGGLMDRDVTPEKLAARVTEFMARDTETLAQLREQSQARHLEQFEARKNAQSVAEVLSKL